MESFFEWEKNVAEKGDNAGYQHFLLRQQCFQKFIPQSHCVMKGKPFPKQTLVFMCLPYKSFENTVGKGEIAHSVY